MTTESKNEPVWVTQQQINEHIKSFGQPGYDRESGTAKGGTEALNPVSDILVRTVEGEIVAVTGSQRLEVKLREFGEARVRFPSGRHTTVVRAPDGQLVEK